MQPGEMPCGMRHPGSAGGADVSTASGVCSGHSPHQKGTAKHSRRGSQAVWVLSPWVFFPFLK